MILLKIYPFLLCLLYAAAVGAYARVFFLGDRRKASVARALLVVTILAHLVYFFLLGAWQHYSVVSTPSIAVSALALSLTIAYFLIEWISREKNMGVWILSLPLVFQVVSALGVFGTARTTELPEASLLGVHVGMAMIGYCAFSLSTAFSVMYLLLYHEIKIRRLGLLFDRLPSLEKLEQMACRAIHFGLGFLLISVLLGEYVFYQVEGRLIFADAKIVLAILAIVVYGAAVLLRKRLAIRGKRLALVAIAGFLLILFSLFVVDYLPGFHRF